jgi:UDP-N-acetylmuramate: L-alanyl-gamma-D-glutamyl-meso-diaminopimelate ligase
VKLHLIGICGTGMGAAAGLLSAAGHEVRGSDEHVYPPMSTQLQELQVTVFEGYRPENLSWGPDAVVVGNVCRKDHVEVLAAQALGIRLTSFPAAMEELLLRGRTNLVVTGTHGKTTTTAQAAWVLEQAGADPAYLIGGVSLNTGRTYALGGGPFVIEGDEYDTAFFDKKSKFLHYLPKVAILTSIELDHVDIFTDLDHIKASFREFVALLPEDGLLLCQGDSPDALEVAQRARCRVERYATTQPGSAGAAGPRVEWRAEPVGTRPGGRTVFEVYRHGERFGTFDTGLPGQYNLDNTLAVIAAVHHLGLGVPAIERGVRLFAGVKRRQESRGQAQGVTVVDDFAHHPTAVKKTLLGLRGRYGRGRLVAVFEPRSATSRTAVFQKEYAEALAVADEVVVGAVHLPDKAPAGNRLDTEQLAAEVRARGVPARALATADEIVEHLSPRLAAGDTVVVMSSGSFDGLHERLLRRLGDAVVPGQAGDREEVAGLLRELSLPADELDRRGDLMVLRDPKGALVGSVGLEILGDVALLHSLAVRPERRGEGLGWMLAEAALHRARLRGLRHIFLLTEHATDFFAEKFGFAPVDPAKLPEAVKGSTEFQVGSSRQAVAMQLDL